ncbi:MAG: hypothetical protein F6K42_15250 [Leptolyngbya sp. SIO1D8]|nr:hypothetical protein [Leptolyngbya sp. SIO1D8]
MIQLVISLNVAIALCGFYIAWRIWLVKRTLGAVATMLAAWERNTHRTLNPERTPDLILKGQQATKSLRGRYARIEQQLQHLRQILAIALMGVRLLQVGGRRRKRSRIR